MITVNDIYRVLDEAAPFCTQESYDNSGLLVGDGTENVTKILLALDITIPVVEEAASLGVELIVSHHPVIWGGLKQISPAHPVWHLIRRDIAAIASHTCMDVATDGTNKAIETALRKNMSLHHDVTPLRMLSGGRTLGCCCELMEMMSAEAFLTALRHTFHCRDLRYYHTGGDIKKIAWCGGSGGDLVCNALVQGADALITGDLKHSEWCEAVNCGMSVFDCGHFSTEQPVLDQFRSILEEAFPSLEIVNSQSMQTPIYKVN